MFRPEMLYIKAGLYCRLHGLVVDRNTLFQTLQIENTYQAMRLRIIAVNFLNDKNWVFKLKGSGSDIEYYIMNSSFYFQNGLRSPIGKEDLDYLNRGNWLNCSVRKIEGINVVEAVNSAYSKNNF